MQLLICAGCECILLSSSDYFIEFECSDFCFWQIWAYELEVLPCPTIDHLSERDFPCLPHWIQKTSSLIESPTMA